MITVQKCSLAFNVKSQCVCSLNLKLSKALTILHDMFLSGKAIDFVRGREYQGVTEFYTEFTIENIS